MTQKKAAGLALVAVFALTGADAVVVYRLEDPARYVLHAALRALALGIAAGAAAFAAARFRWAAEYVGRAWTLLFVLYALLTTSYVLNRAQIATAATSQILTIVANLAAIGAFWLFGRALKRAGLQFYGPAAVKAGVFVGAVAIACALVGPTLVSAWNGDDGLLSRAAEFVSAFADMLTFILVPPLLLTLWSFRGGQLSWVYGCLAASTFGWMINQAADDLLPSVAVRDAQMTGLFMACIAVAVAAYAQLTASRTEAVHV